MSLAGRPRHVPNVTQLASERARSTHASARGEVGVMSAIRVIIAAFIAIIGLTVVLQQAAAEPRLRPELAEGRHRVYLPMIAANAGLTKQADNNSPNAVISVVAQAGLSCKDGEMVPVTGARITVITDHSSRVGMTDEAGYALFSATSEPAVIQIEWPAGLLPCPNSRPMVELPTGTGEVEFLATTAP